MSEQWAPEVIEESRRHLEFIRDYGDWRYSAALTCILDTLLNTERRVLALERLVKENEKARRFVQVVAAGSVHDNRVCADMLTRDAKRMDTAWRAAEPQP